MDGIAQGLKLTVDKSLVFALQLAEKGKGLVEPNPCVGCVLLDDENTVINYGFHKEFGKAHAEVEAFTGVTQEGLTAILTLEPCSHTGKTPPCAELLIEKKIKKLVYIDKDPNPLVSGRGIQMLKDTGIEVIQAPEQYSTINKMLNAKFFYFHENKKTFLHGKWAQTLDGKMSINNTSKWLTSEKSRQYAHFLRAQSESVLIGKSTVLYDNPSLNPRLPTITKKNKVIIIDPNLELLETLKETNICKVREPKDIILVHSLEKPPTSDFNLLYINKNKDGQVDLLKLKESLASQYSIQSAFIEGGAKTLGLFLKSKTLDFASVFIASKILGSKGSSYSDELNLSSLKECYTLKEPVVRTIDSDVVIESSIDYN